MNVHLDVTSLLLHLLQLVFVITFFMILDFSFTHHLIIKNSFIIIIIRRTTSEIIKFLHVLIVIVVVQLPSHYRYRYCMHVVVIVMINSVTGISEFVLCFARSTRLCFCVLWLNPQVAFYYSILLTMHVYLTSLYESALYTVNNLSTIERLAFCIIIHHVTPCSFTQGWQCKLHLQLG